MNEKKRPADLAWADGDGDMLWALAPRKVPPTRSAAYVRTSGDGIYLTVAQCREAAAHLTALADYHEETMPRTAPALPTEPGTVIVPADGHERVEATVYGQTWRAVQAALDFSGNWFGVWRSGAHVISSAAPGQVTPGTWKVADQ